MSRLVYGGKRENGMRERAGLARRAAMMEKIGKREKKTTKEHKGNANEEKGYIDGTAQGKGEKEEVRPV